MNALRQLLTNPLQRLILLSSLTLAACTTTPPVEPVVQAEPEPQAEPLPPQPFEAETLYALLVAELAGARGRYDIALSNYIDQAHKTRDLGLAKRSTLIARQLNAPKTALSSSLLWTELDPSSNEAHLIATTELLNAGRYLEALEKSFALEKLGSHPLYVTIAARAASKPKERKRVLAEIDKKLLERPQDSQLLAAKGILLQSDQPEQSLAIARDIQQREPEFSAALMLEVKSLIQLKRYKIARTRLEELLQQQPDNKRLRLQYARLLANTDLPASRLQFEKLQAKNPKDAELALALALVLFELEDLDAAKPHFQSLIQSPNNASVAHYYLGRINLSQSNHEQAFHHFSLVKPGPDFLAAQVFRLDLLMAKNELKKGQALLDQLYQQYPQMKSKLLLLEIDTYNKHGHYQKAIALMDKILIQDPQNTKLLYQRAMSYYRLDNIDAMERDLRQVIALKPDEAGVMNDLGYTLLTKTDRLKDAGKLIENAFKLKPNDAGIVDSMGWLEYLRGNYPKALELLRKAIKLLPDHEVAAHLGEVLWAMGRHEEAEQVWQKGLEWRPDSPIIQEAQSRLKGGKQ